MTSVGGFGAVTPLSESVLWQLNREWYDQEGTRAWSTGVMPSMITTNAVVGYSYAQAVVAFLREWAEGACADERRQPIHIIELGAGSGRFVFHFLKKLEPRFRAVKALRDVEVRYVMTDFARSTIDAWRRHERLAPLVAEGRLDFAAFDAAWPAPMRLVHAGTVLDPATPAPGPIVIIANYVIDSLPLDAFIREGRDFEEFLVKVTVRDRDAPLTSLDDVELDWTRSRVDRGRYREPEHDRLLHSLAARLGDRTLLFPVTFLHTLGFLRRLNAGPTMLLSADKGYNRTPIEAQRVPYMATHGTGSFNVDYSVIAAYVRQQNGVAFLPAYQSVSLATAGFVLDGAAHD
nr:SAM-dependent methyltransferase [Actinomycetota bacterium]